MAEIKRKQERIEVEQKRQSRDHLYSSFAKQVKFSCDHQSQVMCVSVYLYSPAGCSTDGLSDGHKHWDDRPSIASNGYAPAESPENFLQKPVLSGDLIALLAAVHFHATRQMQPRRGSSCILWTIRRTDFHFISSSGYIVNP